MEKNRLRFVPISMTTTRDGVRVCRNDGEKGVGKAENGLEKGGDEAFNRTMAKFQEPLIVILVFWKTTRFYLSPWFCLG